MEEFQQIKGCDNMKVEAIHFKDFMKNDFEKNKNSILCFE